MSEKTLSNPAVEVNNNTVGIIPNTLTYKRGKGDLALRPQSAGGDSIEMIKTENAETKKGMVKFSLYNTKTNADLYESWQDLTDGVSIQFSDEAFVRAFRNMFIITDPEVALGADGNIELEFEGNPAN